MTEAELKAAAEAVATASTTIAELRTELAGLVVERQEWERGQRHTMIAQIILAALLLVVLVYLVPLAKGNNESLNIIRSVTGPEAQVKAQRATDVLVCGMVNDNRSIHGVAPVDPCPPPSP